MQILKLSFVFNFLFSRLQLKKEKRKENQDWELAFSFVTDFQFHDSSPAISDRKKNHRSSLLQCHCHAWCFHLLKEKTQGLCSRQGFLSFFFFFPFRCHEFFYPFSSLYGQMFFIFSSFPKDDAS